MTDLQENLDELNGYPSLMDDLNKMRDIAKRLQAENKALRKRLKEWQSGVDTAWIFEDDEEE